MHKLCISKIIKTLHTVSLRLTVYQKKSITIVTDFFFRPYVLFLESDERYATLFFPCRKLFKTSNLRSRVVTSLFLCFNTYRGQIKWCGFSTKWQRTDKTKFGANEAPQRLLRLNFLKWNKFKKETKSHEGADAEFPLDLSLSLKF